MTLRDKMLAVMKDVNSQVAEREELVELIAIALLTRNNLFILGKPGQAKSLSINLFRQRITGARQFERLLSKQTDEDQLFGRIDLSSLIPGSVPDAVLQDDDVHKNLRFDLQSMVDGLGARKDTPDTFAMLEKATDKLLSYRKAVAALHQNEPVVQTAGKIPEADIVFLDEIFKANDGVLNSLLTALNERKYTNEGRTYPIPAISFFSASNEIPKFADPQEQILAPLYDRLQIKVVTEDIADRDKRLSVLKSKQNGGDGSVNATISLSELYAMQQEVAAIPVPDAINELADDVLCELRGNGIEVSDRKYLNYYPLVQAKAWLEGHDKVESQDLLILKCYLWQTPSDRPTVENTLTRLCVNPLQDMTLLQNYRATKRKIEQLRYELEHPTRVTPDEMIEAMNFAKGDGEGRPSGSVSNKTLYIAMNFQSAADEANASLTHDLVSRLVPLEQEINRLEHYVALLEPRQAEVIRLAYFEGHTWQQISAKTQITTRTLYKIRNQAVEELAEMYALTADLQR